MVNPFEIWNIYQNHIRKQKELTELRVNLECRLNELGFDISYEDNPIAAIELAKKYKLDLHGRTVGGICAAIEKNNWARPLNPDINQFEYGVWALRPIEEIDSIFGYGKTVEEAVCRCLINARIAGVI